MREVPTIAWPLLHVQGGIASARVFKKLGRSEGLLALLLLRSLFLSAVRKTPGDMALLIVELNHNVQPVQSLDYLYYLFEDWKDLLTEVRWADSLSKEMVHQSEQVLLQRFQPALARASRYMQESGDPPSPPGAVFRSSQVL